VETGQRWRWTEDEKLRIVAESLSGRRLAISPSAVLGVLATRQANRLDDGDWHRR
jgi:transposase-like protein